MSAAPDLRALRAAVFAAVCVALSAAGHILAAGTGVPAVTLILGFAAVLALALPLAGRERTLPGIAGLLALGQLGLHVLFSCGQRHMSAAGAHGQGASGSGDGGVRSLARSLLCNDAASGMTDAEAHAVVSRSGLSAGGAGHSGGAGSAAHAGAGHAASGAIPGLPDSPLDCLRGAARAAFGLLDAPMLLGHLLAALALGWLLRRGEAALWRLVRLSAELAATADEIVAARALRAALTYVRALAGHLGGPLPHMPAAAVGARARDERVPPPVALQHSVHRRGPPALRADSLALAA